MTRLRTSWSIEYDSDEIYIHIADKDCDGFRIIIPFNNIAELKEFKNSIDREIDGVIQFLLNTVDNELLLEDL